MYMHTNFSSFHWLGCYMLYMWVRHGRLLMRVLMMDMSYDTCVFGITVLKATQNLCLRYNRKTAHHRYTYMCVITCFFFHVCKRVFFFLRSIISQHVQQYTLIIRFQRLKYHEKIIYNHFKKKQISVWARNYCK